jgi:ribonuclease BN (tRNA processing enzyme)
VLGSGGPELDDGRASSSYLVWLDGRASVLVDTGSGSGLRFAAAGARIEDLQAIAFTHLHVDHSVDLPAFVKASFFGSRDRDLPILGPTGNALMPATSEFLQRLFGAQGAWQYLSDYVDPQQHGDYLLRPQDVPLTPLRISHYPLSAELTLSAIPVHHGPIAAVAWRVEAAGCAITFSGDMNNRYQTLARLAQGSDLLVMHNAIPEDATGVARQLHMPPSEIGAIAKQAGARQVILSHRMNRTLGRETETLTAIRQHYDGPVVFSDDLDKFPLR